MKADEIGPQHPVKNLPLPGTDAEGLGVRPGDVPEEGQPGIGPFFLDHPREKGEMVILDQNPGVPGVFQFLQRGPGELSVDRFVEIPIFGLKNRAGMGDVAQGPEPFVGKPVVIPLFLFLGKPHPFEQVLGVFRGNPDFILVVHHLPVGIPASMGQPGSPARLEDRLQSRHQAAGGDDAFDLFAAPFMDVGLPIGNHEERLSLQQGAHVFPKPHRGPERLGLAPQTGLLLGGGTGLGNAFGHPGGFPGQGFEDFSGRGRQGNSPFFGSQGLHPFGHPGDGVDHAPADHQKGSQGDEKSAHQQADEIILPDVGHPVFDLFGFIDHHHGPGEFLFMIKGKGMEVHLLLPEGKEISLF